jgi:hypothetical protein
MSSGNRCNCELYCKNIDSCESNTQRPSDKESGTRGEYKRKEKQIHNIRRKMSKGELVLKQNVIERNTCFFHGKVIVQ